MQCIYLCLSVDTSLESTLWVIMRRLPLSSTDPSFTFWVAEIVVQVARECMTTKEHNPSKCSAEFLSPGWWCVVMLLLNGRGGDEIESRNSGNSEFVCFLLFDILSWLGSSTQLYSLSSGSRALEFLHRYCSQGACRDSLQRLRGRLLFPPPVLGAVAFIGWGVSSLQRGAPSFHLLFCMCWLFFVSVRTAVIVLWSRLDSPGSPPYLLAYYTCRLSFLLRWCIQAAEIRIQHLWLTQYYRLEMKLHFPLSLVSKVFSKTG